MTRVFGNTTREELQRCVSRMLVQCIHIQPGSLVPCSGLMTHSQPESSCTKASGHAVWLTPAVAWQWEQMTLLFSMACCLYPTPLVLWAIAIPLGQEPASRQALPSARTAPAPPTFRRLARGDDSLMAVRPVTERRFQKKYTGGFSWGVWGRRWAKNPVI
jgi:hypothetical protein